MRMKDLPTREDVLRYLDYNPETGVFVNRIGRRGLAAGKVCGCLDPDGYLVIRIPGGRYFAHRLAWKIVYGSDPIERIDHFDGDRSNCRITNLRLATGSTNQFNRGATSGCVSGLKGVSKDKRCDRWIGSVRCNGTRYRRSFPTVQEAHEWTVEVRNRVHGEYAKH